MMPQPGRLNAEAHGLGGRLLDLLFPPRCVNCNQVGSSFCANCLGLVEPIPPPYCPRCGHPLASPRSACPDCRVYVFSITQIRAAVWHEGPVRHAVHALKYKRRRELAPPLSELLVPVALRAPIKFDLVTSVPLSPSRELERGYNQAELLAEHLATQIRSTYVRTLRRVRATPDQVGLDGEMRRNNVQGAFAQTEESVRGRHVLLIDDVCTTGATLDASARVLKQGGAQTVYGLTVARPRSAY